MQSADLLLTPAQERKALKAKVKALKSKLPEHWILLFIHDHKEYTGQSVFLSNVMRAKSLHAPTITKIELWVESLKK